MFWKFRLWLQTSQRKGSWWQRCFWSVQRWFLANLECLNYKAELQGPDIWGGGCVFLLRLENSALFITLYTLQSAAWQPVWRVRSCVSTATYTIKLWDFSYRGHRTWPGHVFSFSGPRESPQSQDGWPQRACPPRTALVEGGLVDCKNRRQLSLFTTVKQGRHV